RQAHPPLARPGAADGGGGRDQGLHAGQRQEGRRLRDDTRRGRAPGPGKVAGRAEERRFLATSLERVGVSSQVDDQPRTVEYNGPRDATVDRRFEPREDLSY